MPLTFGSRVIGVIVVSKLGLDQFDKDDLRVLEVLAGHTSVALENARLYEAQKREAESATALLAFARDVAEAEGIVGGRRTGRRRHGTDPGRAPSLALAPGPTSGDLVGSRREPGAPAADERRHRVPAQHLGPWLARTEPYMVEAADYAASSRRRRAPTGASRSRRSRVDGRWGVIAAAIPRDDAFGDRELELLGGSRIQTKLALQSAASYETLERTFLSTVEALANALEANDESTSTHARWITDLALRVGEELGLGATGAQEARARCSLPRHRQDRDPGRILTKPGPLTPEERGVVETHPLLGERILAPIVQLEEVRSIVRTRHEHFDGTGYPDRLAGERSRSSRGSSSSCDASTR